MLLLGCLVAVLLVFILGFAVGHANRPVSAPPQPDSSVAIGFAISDAIVALSKETSADASVLRRIVSEPFEKRGLIRRT